jgi:hypothetical protein
MQVVLAYEHSRQAEVVDVSAGGHPSLRIAFDQLGIERPSIPSADYVSTLHDEVRIIEVKSRGSKGPIEALQREIETLARAHTHAWLYVVWNATQPLPFELCLIQDPYRLQWKRKPGPLKLETRYELPYAVVESASSAVDLEAIEGLPTKDRS